MQLLPGDLLRPVLMLLLGTAVGCTVLPKDVSEKSSLKPGQTLLESSFLKGVPDLVGEFNGDSAVRFPDETYWVVRMGRLSHQLAGGNYALKVDSITSKSAKPNAYFLTVPKSKEEDLFWLSYLDAIKRAFKERGLALAPTLAKADALVEFEFAQEGKEEVVTQTQLVPVTSYSVTSVKGNNIGAVNYQGNSSTTSMVPVVSTSTEMKYVRGLTIKAISKKDRKALWTVNVDSVGTTGDRRTNFAAVTLGAMKYFERDSNREFVFPVASNDPYINLLKTGEERGIYRVAAKQWLGETLNFCVAEAKNWRGARFGYSPLGLAIQLHDVPTTSALIDCGHDVDVGHYKSNLMIAAETGDKDMFTTVLNASKVRNELLLGNLKALKDKSFATSYETKFPPPKATVQTPKG